LPITRKDVILSSEMSTEHILTLLISERDRLNRAIAVLGTPVKRRGRPQKAAPEASAAVEAAATPVRKRKPMTAAQKRSLSLKMKAAWAKRKKQG
jgi:hypothetical protein